MITVDEGIRNGYESMKDSCEGIWNLAYIHIYKLIDVSYWWFDMASRSYYSYVGFCIVIKY